MAHTKNALDIPVCSKEAWPEDSMPENCLAWLPVVKAEDMPVMRKATTGSITVPDWQPIDLGPSWPDW